MTTLTVEIRIKELDRRETFTFIVEGQKVTPLSKGTFVDQADGQVVLGFGFKIDLKETP